MNQGIEWCKQQSVLLFKSPETTINFLSQSNLIHINNGSSPLNTLLDFLFQHNLSSIVCNFIVDVHYSVSKSEESQYTLKNPRAILDWCWKSFTEAKDSLIKDCSNNLKVDF